MKIGLIGPTELTELDKREIEENLEDFISKGNEIVLLAYRSIEIEIFKFFVKHIDDELTPSLASKLHIYTFQPLPLLPEKIRTPIEYLVEKGATHRSFGFQETLVRRNFYVETWRQIIQDVDLMICFYNGEKPTLLIPIDEAKRQGKKAVIYQLPKDDEDLYLLQPDQKIKVIE